MGTPGRAVLAALATSAVLGLSSAAPAAAGPILDRVRRDGIVRCAATERPGYAEIENGQPTGRAADLCRAVAERALGKGGRFALRLLDLDDDFTRVRRRELDLVFLEPRIVADQKLSAALQPVGPAYQDRFAVMVPVAARMDRLADLSGRSICFMIGDPVWPLLQAGLQHRSVPFRPFGFSEEVEMKDAYNVGRCDAVAGAASELGELREDGGVKHLASRLIDEPLGPDPVEAMVPPGDSDWAVLVRKALPRPVGQAAPTP